ncbi:MAG TPA: tripartite tricarboxylate transporter substrate-binding protein [Burkholderiales bacterium]|nr:tripartite tricarboxylate transporter substrate-binding protein [Burkholderiales bacterium]
MRAITAALALCAFSFLAHAQPVASRAVHLIVPYTPATGADILARALGPKLQERWKVAVVTENKPGATGNIGTEFVAKAPADGNTLLFAATSFATNPALGAVPYDAEKSFAPVILAATSALGMVVNPRVPAQSIPELIELAKREPGKLHYGSPGNGGVQHLAMELFKLEAGVNLVHVPYKGLGGMLNDLVGGHVQVGVAALQSVHPHVQAGRLRMLGQLEVETWYAVFAPAGTPAPAIAKLNADLHALLQDAQMREFLAKQGMTAAGGPPERLGELVRRELARWTRVVKIAGIKAD